jgi:hypothetical protein
MIFGCMSSVEYLKRACYTRLGQNKNERKAIPVSSCLLQASFDQSWNRKNLHGTIGDHNNSVSSLRCHVLLNIKPRWLDTPTAGMDNTTMREWNIQANIQSDVYIDEYWKTRSLDLLKSYQI